MKTRSVLFSALLLAMLGGCYGRASPTNCYEKYVSDGKGEGEDNYENCLARYESRQRLVRAQARDEVPRWSMFRRPARTPLVVVNNVSEAPPRAPAQALTCYPQADGSLSCTPQ
jgi:hypothetical protein